MLQLFCFPEQQPSLLPLKTPAESAGTVWDQQQARQEHLVELMRLWGRTIDRLPEKAHRLLVSAC